MNNKACPFCGSEKLKVDSKTAKRTKYIGSTRYNTITASVRCNRCFSRGPTVSMDYLYDNFEDHNRVIKELDIKAFEKWNNRN